MSTTDQNKEFSLNSRVTVSSAGGWKQSSTGTICDGPEIVKTLQGVEFFYWVKFDESQEDINGTDKYYKAQILSRYLVPLL